MCFVAVDVIFCAREIPRGESGLSGSCRAAQDTSRDGQPFLHVFYFKLVKKEEPHCGHKALAANSESMAIEGQYWS